MRKDILVKVPSLKLTAKAPENGWLEYDCFPLGPGLFSGAMLVSGRVVVGKIEMQNPTQPC